MDDGYLQLADYRRQVAVMYQGVREPGLTAESRLHRFRAARDELFRDHPQSPIPRAGRHSFHGLEYWPHDPGLRLTARLEPVVEPRPVPRSGGGEMNLQRIGFVSFRLADDQYRLGVYWFTDYAGGVFIPFRDRTNGAETYGGGRYLWDSAKGADLGSADGGLILDFNYAYHPSCAYDPRWSCPLAPPDNRLDVPIRAGERLTGK